MRSLSLMDRFSVENVFIECETSSHRTICYTSCYLVVFTENPNKSSDENQKKNRIGERELAGAQAE